VIADVIYIRQQALWSLVVATAAILVLGFWIGHRLRKPLLRMVDFAQAIAAGNLTGMVNVESQDEMGALAQACNTMSWQLRQMLQGITTHAATLQEAAGRLEMTSACMAQNTNDMSEKTTLTASTAKSMSANMALATASAADATNNVDSVAVATEEMTATVSDIARNAEQAREVTTAAVSSVTVASQRVGELGVRRRTSVR
jgi:methyl-accepting chemotaxis protein